MKTMDYLQGLPRPAPEKKEAGGTDTAEIKRLIGEYMTAFNEFKSKAETELKDLKTKGAGDVVTKDEMKNINLAMTDIKKLVDDLRLEVKRPAGGGGEDDTEKKQARSEHRKAFDLYVRKGRGDDNLRDLEAKASLVGSDPDGGYLVPADISTTVERILSEASPVRQLCDVMTISTSVHKRPVTTTGAAAGWVGETDSRPQTNTPKLNELTFPTMELYAMPAATQTLLDDAAVNIEEWLANEVQITFAEQEGDAFINGNGVNKPHGFLQYTTGLYAGTETWGTVHYVKTGEAADFPASPNQADPLIDLVHAIKAGYRNGASWIMNRATMGKVRKFKDSNGDYIWRPGIAEGKPDTILGYALTEAEDMPDVAANAFPVAFGNFRMGYLIVDRIGVRVLRDPFSAKPYVLFYTTKRVGGGIKMFEAIKLLKCEA